MKPTKVAIIYNPESGKRRGRGTRLRQMVNLLEQNGIKTDLLATTCPNDATRLAREAVGSGAQVVVSHGGDGTLNEVIQGMAGSEAALAVWPGGTENVAARELKMPFSVPGIAEVITRGRTKRVALGKVTCENSDAKGRLFLMFAGIGLDAAICEGLNHRLKRYTGRVAYAVAGIQLLSRVSRPFQVQVDGKSFTAGYTLVGNGRLYGGGVLMTPGARLEDGWFEVFVLPRRSRNVLYLFPLLKCFFGKPEKTDAVIMRAERVTIGTSTNGADGRPSDSEPTARPWIQIDGEVAGRAPATFDIVPDALSIVVA